MDFPGNRLEPIRATKIAVVTPPPPWGRDDRITEVVGS